MRSIPFKGLPVRSKVRPTYRLQRDPLLGSDVLVKDGFEDIGEMIQSSYASSLDCILDRFLEDLKTTGEASLPDPPADGKSSVGDLSSDLLDIFGDYCDLMEEVREVYDLPASYSNSQVSKFLEQNYNDFIEKQKGVNENGKEISQSNTKIEESQNVSEDV